ncbi:MAG TPA: polysaccharide biosynthesis tyrosine autokinase [Sphingomonadaceae bacterium]|nr:polysaccharide biosynthesis tyrosine autokinase [Sphingomonadaceae bacterium]
MNDGSGAFPDKGSFAFPVDRRGRSLAVPGSSALVAFEGPAAEAATPGFNANDIIRTILKWRWLILGVTLACVLAAIVVSLMITPTYRGTVTLEINREPTRIVSQGSDVEPSRANDNDFVSTQIGLLRSRSLAERVARTLNLGSDEDFASQEAGTRASREQAAVGALIGGLQVEPLRNTRLVNVSFESTDPQDAARVANAFADNFIESNLERRYTANNFARDFLQKRLVTVKAALEKSERAAVDYATRQGIIQLSPGGGGDKAGSGESSLDAASLMQLNTALATARTERISAEQRLRQDQGSRASSESLANPTVLALTSQRAQLEAEYQEKLGIYQPEFPQMQQIRARINALTRGISNATSNVSGTVAGSLRADYAAAVARENELQSRVNSLKSSVMDLRKRGVPLTILQREVDTNRAAYDALLEREKSIGIAGVGTNLIGIVDRAQVPGGPVKPNLPLNVLMGLALGLLLGLGAAFAIEFIDDTIKNPDDLSNKLQLTSLGLIPTGPKDTPLIEVLNDPRAPVTEAYHSVRTALQFASDHGVPKTLLVTSTRAAEGKSSTSMALAQNFARLGASVLLIDADLRKPSFRAPSASGEGLSNLLAGGSNIRECIHKTNFDRLFLLPSGPIPPNPAELLSTDRFRTILNEVAGWFDYVVVDAPPVLGLADAPLLSSVCEGTLMVFEAGKVRRGAALNAVNRLRGADARLLGGVLTKYNTKHSGYGYGYAYVDESYSYGVGQERQRQIELIS